MGDIYKKYGLTKETAAAKGIRPLEYLKIESPEFAEEASRIPSEVADLIEKQELVWALSIESTYGQRRRWNEILAVRELLQNSLDAEHEAVGYDKLSVKIESDARGTWIKDRGKGITYKAFILGGEEKPCQMRGAYGEGLKLTLIWFTALSGAPYRLYFFTRGKVVFTCYYSKLADALVIVFGRSKYSAGGTHVLLSRYYMPPEVKKLYFKTAGFKPVCKTVYSIANCEVPMPNLVLSPGGSLYVRDLYVNAITKITGKRPAWFSYNLWWVTLEPNREMVNSLWNFKSEVAYTLAECPAITEMIESCLVKKSYGGVDYYELEDKYFETTVDYTAATIDEEVTKAVESSMKKHRITAISNYGDFDGMTAVAHEGGVCVLIPSEMFPLFSELPRASEFVLRSITTMVEGAVPVDERTISGYERGHLQIWRLWRDYICPKVNIRLIEGGRSFYDDKTKTICMAEDDLEYYHDDVFIHELSHAYGYEHYKTAPDLSENFERALAEVAKEIFSFLLNVMRKPAVDRCDHGCFNATPKTEEEFFGGIYKNLPADERSSLISNPRMFIIFYKPYHTDRWYYYPSGFVGDNRPPAEETYDKRVKQAMKVLRELYNKFKRGEITWDEAVKVLDDVRLSLSVDVLSAEKLIVYVYDIEKDKYKYLETIE